MGILDEKHKDWPWPLKYIPRSWNSVKSDVPPKGIFGHTDHPFDYLPSSPLIHLDVPLVDREWALSYCKYGFMFTMLVSGWLFRIGTFRYDYVDKYYTFPTLTIKRHTPPKPPESQLVSRSLATLDVALGTTGVL